MKKLLMTAATLLALMQLKAQSVEDSSTFKSRKLKLEEINLISSYYSQDGIHSSVTGGTGTEKLTDIANVIDLTLTRYDKNTRKQTITGELGIDHYTSASSDKVDLKANSSASSADTRFYPSLSLSSENETKGNTYGFGVSSSVEYDYTSIGAFISYAQKTKDKNGEFSAKAQAFLDQVKLILPIELRTGSGRDESSGSAARNSFAGSISYSQVVNKNFQLSLTADAVQQQGYLSLPFHRVYFQDGTVHQENLPDTRLKIPLGVRANYFAGDKIIFRSWYRFYKDDWGIKAHTANIEIPVKLTSFLSVSPFYRYYNQSAADYFAAYKVHTAANEFYTSNYDLSAFSSNFYGAGIRMTPPGGVFNIQRLSMLEIRYGHYTRSEGLHSNIVSLNLKFK